LGSIPGAYIIARLSKGIDIRKVDTGNVGAASTMRAIGIWQGIIVAAIDIAKGSAAILTAQALGVSLPWILGAGFAAFIGHNYPIYIGFKGGQGAATVIGIFLALTPFATLCTLIVLAIVLCINFKVILRRFFLAILVAGPTLPIFIWIFYGSIELVIYAAFIVAFMICKNWHSVKIPWEPGGSSRKAKGIP
jgi:glycerol-3-phosphate acyltransferase PlsY